MRIRCREASDGMGRRYHPPTEEQLSIILETRRAGGNKAKCAAAARYWNQEAINDILEEHGMNEDRRCLPDGQIPKLVRRKQEAQRRREERAEARRRAEAMKPKPGMTDEQKSKLIDARRRGLNLLQCMKEARYFNNKVVRQFLLDQGFPMQRVHVKSIQATQEKIDEVIALRKKGMRYQDIVKETGLRAESVTAICKKNNLGKMVPEWHALLTQENAAAIRSAREKGNSIRSLSRDFGIPRAVITEICRDVHVVKPDPRPGSGHGSPWESDDKSNFPWHLKDLVREIILTWKDGGDEDAYCNARFAFEHREWMEPWWQEMFKGYVRRERGVIISDYEGNDRMRLRGRIWEDLRPGFSP